MRLTWADYVLLYLTISITVFSVAWYGATQTVMGFGIFKIFSISLITFFVIYIVFFIPRFNKRRSMIEKDDEKNDMYSDL